PAMAVTLMASWLVASSGTRKRNWGFWVFLLSNVLWIIWGVKSQSWALVVLQLGLMVMNIRGAMKTERSTAAT
ncbi:MAG: amino acid transporter, partial [Polaromonas sp.]|nr:amino acid transporter [Polaromonas sp.]